MIDILTTFFSTPLFIIVGGFSILAMIGGFIYTICIVISGVMPVWIRLGFGLSKSVISVFSLSEFDNLCDMLVDSKLFKRKNIRHMRYDNLKNINDSKIFLVHWKDFGEKIEEIIALKRDHVGLIVYAPHDEGRIDQDKLLKINNERNSLVVNFRGRLMNDILLSLVVVNYERK